MGAAPSTRPTLGVALMSLATLGFGCMTVMVKLMDTALPEPELVFWRAVLSLPLLVLLVLRARRAWIVEARWTLVLRSLFGFTAMMLFFYSLGRLTLAEAQILIRIQPVWIALLAPMVVGDRPGRGVWVSLALCLVGVGLVLGPAVGTGIVSMAGLAALASSLFSALAHLQLRKLGRTDHPDVVVLNFTAMLLVLGGLISIPVATMPQPGHWPLLIGLALGAMMGQMFMTSAYRVAPAPLVATVGYVALPVAALLDWVVFRHAPTLWAIGGGLLIIASGVYLAYQRPAGHQAAAGKPGK